jgi:hypothetical protein
MDGYGKVILREKMWVGGCPMAEGRLLVTWVTWVVSGLTNTQLGTPDLDRAHQLAVYWTVLMS